MTHAPTAVSDPAGTAVARIREDIVSGTFAPGQRLVEAELCERLHASRATVRAALAELDHEGSSSGSPTAAPNCARSRQRHHRADGPRGTLRRQGGRERHPDQITELREIGSGMKNRSRPVTFSLSVANVRLHDLVRRIADQPIADEILVRLLARNIRHQFQLALRPGRPQISLSEHLAIIDEICARQPEAAERAARRHIESVIRALRETTAG